MYTQYFVKFLSHHSLWCKVPTLALAYTHYVHVLKTHPEKVYPHKKTSPQEADHRGNGILLQ